MKKQRFSQLTTREQALLKQKNSDLTKEWQNCYLYHDHYIYKLTDETVFHARDSIMAVRQIEVMEVNKNEVVYKNKTFKYEVCVKDSFSKEIAVKSISQEWLEENIAFEYWEYIQKHEQNKAWFIVSRDDGVEDEFELMKCQTFNYKSKEWKKTV